MYLFEYKFLFQINHVPFLEYYDHSVQVLEITYTYSKVFAPETDIKLILRYIFHDTV